MKIKSQTKLSRKNLDGFTLIEIIVYFGLLSVILLIITNLFLSISESFLESKSKSSVVIEGNFVLERLAYDIRRADKIVSPGSPGDSGSILNLKIGADNYIYSLSGPEINLQAPASSAVPITGSLVTASNLKFTSIGSAEGKPTVLIDFTLSGSSTEGPKTQNFNTVVGIR